MALGVVLGLTFAIDLLQIPSDLVVLFPIGVLTGAAFWLLLRLVPAPAGRGTASRRRPGDVPLLLRLLLGVIVGVVAMLAVLAFAPPVEVALYLVIGAAAAVVGLRTGLGRAVPCGSVSAETDAFTSWGRDRAAQLAVWIVGCLVVTAIAMRSLSGMIAVGLFGTPPGPLSTLVAGLSLSFVGGLVLGLSFPATWLLSLAWVQLRVRDGLPPRLMRLLRDARDRGAVRTVGPEFDLSVKADAEL